MDLKVQEIDFREKVRGIGTGAYDLDEILHDIEQDGITPQELYQALRVESSELSSHIAKKIINLEKIVALTGVVPKTAERWKEGSTKVLPKYWCKIREINESQFSKLRDAVLRNGDIPPDLREFYYQSATEYRSSSLIEVSKSFEAKIAEVYRAPTGIQFVLYSFCHNGEWQPHTNTGFLAGEPGSAKSGGIKHFIENEETRGEVRRLMNKLGRSVFDAQKALEEKTGSKESGEPSFGQGVETCEMIPSKFVDEVRYRWIYRPYHSFLFLAGGIGPDQRQKDWLVSSREQLDLDNSDSIIRELERFREAFVARYRT